MTFNMSYNLDDKKKCLSVTFSLKYSADDRLIFIVLFPRITVLTFHTNCMKSQNLFSRKKEHYLKMSAENLPSMLIV